MKRKKDFILQNVGGSKILIPVGSQVMDLNGIVTLNETGSYVWGLLAEEHTENELAIALANQFNLEISTALADVQIFLEDISKMGLLEE